MKGEVVFSILYVADDEIYKVGPYSSEEEALAYVSTHNYTEDGEDSEFDINDQHIYLLDPNHVLTELCAADLLN